MKQTRSESLARTSLAAMVFFSVLFSFCLLACSSTPKYGWTEDESIPADGVDPAAMGPSNFTVRKHIPTHEENRIDFYYKHCDLDSRSAITSKTSYFCDEP